MVPALELSQLGLGAWVLPSGNSQAPSSWVLGSWHALPTSSTLSCVTLPDSCDSPCLAQNGVAVMASWQHFQEAEQRTSAGSSTLRVWSRSVACCPCSGRCKRPVDWAAVAPVRLML